MTSKQIRLDTDLIARAKALFPELADDEDKDFIEWVMRSLLTRVLVRSDSVTATAALPQQAVTRRASEIHPQAVVATAPNSDEVEAEADDDAPNWDNDP